MALVTCPDCETRFVSRGRSPVCPECGADIAASRRRMEDDDDDDRPVRRRRRRDDDDDDRPVRRRSSGGNSLTPVLIVCGGLVALLVVGGFAVGLYLVGSRAKARPQANAPAPVFNQPAPVFQPVAPPPLPAPIPAPAPAPAPVQPPAGLKGGGAAGVAVTLSNLRRERGFGARDDILVDIEFTGGSLDSFRDVVMVKSNTGTTEVMLHGLRGRRVTARWRADFAQAGRLEVWLERKDRPGMMAQGTRVSNVVTLN